MSDSPGNPERAYEAQLLAAVGAGDRGEPLRILYGRYAGRVYGLGVQLLGDRGLAEELVQETFLRVWRTAARYDPDRGSPPTFIFTIARRLAIDLWRRPSSRPAGAEPPPPPDDDRVDSLLARLEVREALRSLSDAHRQVLELSYLEHLKQAEIAERRCGSSKQHFSNEASMTDMSPHAEPHPDVAGYLLGTLTDREAAAFADHLTGCAACRAELEELRWLAGVLDELPPAEPLPPGLEERTFAAIERDATMTAPPTAGGTDRPDGRPDVDDPPSRAGGGGGGGGDAGGGGVVIPLRRTSPNRRWSRPTWLISAAAAVIVVLLGVGVVSRLRSGSSAPLAVVHLVGPGGNAARGTATVHATLTGLIIDLSVTHLAPSPPGTFYTCWLVGPGDTLSHQNRVSVGSFVVGASGAATVHWATGADLRRFPTLGVTLEPANGNPLHQGAKVLQTV